MKYPEHAENHVNSEKKILGFTNPINCSYQMNHVCLRSFEFDSLWRGTLLSFGWTFPFVLLTQFTARQNAVLQELYDSGMTRACFLSLARSKLRLCSANHRAGYFSNLACDWLSIVWAYSEQETENGPCTGKSCKEKIRQAMEQTGLSEEQVKVRITITCNQVMLGSY